MNQSPTPEVNVVVVFYSRTGQTEKLALAAAVGAVQARANIRLRRLPETADEKTIAGVPEWRENRDRMDKEYVSPREADARWADAIAIGMSARFGVSSPEMKALFNWLEPLRSQGQLAGKLGTAFTPDFTPKDSTASGENDSALISLYTAIAQFGLIVVPFGDSGQQVTASAASGLEKIRLHGRRVAEIARAVKQASVHKG